MKIIIKQFAKFGIVGFINTAIDFLAYAALTRFFDFWHNHKNTTVCLSFILANINSYILNKYWTFSNDSKKHKVQYSKFFIVSVMGLGINLLIFDGLVRIGVYDLIAKIAPIPIVLLWNFVINKYWTFNNKEA